MNFDAILEGIGGWVASTGIYVFIVLIVTLIAFKLIRVLSSRLAEIFGKQKIDEESKKRAVTLHCDDYIVKPVETKVLESKVEKALSQPTEKKKK